MTTAESRSYDWTPPATLVPVPGGGDADRHAPPDNHHCPTCGQPLGYWAIDKLTGVLDRWGWDGAAPGVIHRARQRREPVALLLLDLDYFKSVNDRFGHVAGDMVLRSVADVMRRATREADVVGRYGGHGGDEFLALLPTTNRDRALVVANRIRDGVRAMQVTVPDAGSGVRATLSGQTVSIGIGLHVPAGGGEPTLDDLLLDADAALLIAKREGRDRIRVLNRPTCRWSDRAPWDGEDA